MAKITVAGNAVVVTSAMKYDDLKTIAKYRPEAMTLMGGEDGKEPIFAVSVCKGNGEINQYGATFGLGHDAERRATITKNFEHAEDGDIKEIVADKIGSAIIKLEKLEAVLPDVLAEIAAEKSFVMDSITVAQ